jgi:hypothetical protein
LAATASLKNGPSLAKIVQHLFDLSISIRDPAASFSLAGATGALFRAHREPH